MNSLLQTPAWSTVGLAALLLITSHAPAATISITTENGNGADAYINTGNATLRSTNYGADDKVNVKLTTGTYESQTVNRKGYLRFDITGYNLAANPSATLKLTTTEWNNTVTLQVYGLINGSAGENWGESTITWDNAPGNTGTAATSNTFDASAILLGSFTQSATANGTLINFSSTALNNFLSADTDGLVTLMFVRTTANNNFNSTFASKEHATFAAPTLEFETIPEPSATALLAAGSAFLAFRRRRRA